ncbi:carbohydrate ABC transporter permease [Ruminiclostridium cellobioparum]|uniref:Sugar ABC transporter permease n=1 Tax=Ruminiclostridium cellobioparum subsp. termitidis CT1112 TaxID=1195236 RepID=S0FNQ7_RUMCE|nr:sugar ABC transporter permease [Ruminiclostridium cellobioparum]EMS73532.1 sugar ABC transporter permease [Ruminiclostridium cellobioparum subsp. termitidis CT1112]
MKNKINKLTLPVLFLAPVFLIYTTFLFVPMLQTSYYSLTQWNGVSEKVFIGLGNYKELLKNNDYWITFFNTLKLTAVSLIVQISFGLLLAYLLYTITRGMKIFRTVFFLPVVIAPVAIGLMFSLFYNSEIGIFNKILSAVGLDMIQTNWLSNPKTLLYAVMAPQVWQYIGLYVTIFLGALQSIPEDLIESAQIDGAGEVKTFFHVVLPQLSVFLNICIVLCVTGSLKAFDHSYIMTNGGPGVRSAYLGVFMYKTAFGNSDFGMGSAITITIILISLTITLLFNRFAASGSEN